VTALARYGLGVVSVAVAMVVALSFRPVTIAGGQLLLVAVLVTGWVGGLGPALVAWVLAFVVFAYHFTAPFDSFTIAPGEFPRLIIFALVAGLMATVSAARRRAQDALQSARDRLEERVRERTAALERSNERLQAAVADAVAAQQRFGDLVDSVEGIVWEADAGTFGFSFVSRQAERILGYRLERWLSEPTFWTDHLHPDDRNVALGVREDANREQRRHDAEYRMIAADGSVVWLHDLVTVVADGGRLRGVMVDVTERKRAEAERHGHVWLLESLDRVNRAIQGTTELEHMTSKVLEAVLSSLDCDRAALVYPCDPKAASWRVPMEQTRPEFPGAFLLGLEQPMDADAARVFETALAAGDPVRFGPDSQHPLPTEMAKRFSIKSQITTAVHPKGDRPYLFVLHQCSYPRVWTQPEERLVQEIGQRLADALSTQVMLRNLRASEARLEQAQRIAHVGYWDFDLDDDAITWSAETYRIFGLAPHDPDLGQARLWGLIHPDDRARIAAAIAEVRRGGGRYDAEYRVVHPGGEVRTVHSHGDVVSDASGRPRRLFGIVRDVTDRKRAEDALRDSEEQWRAVFQNSPSMYFMVDGNGAIVSVNHTGAEQLGYTVDELIGRPVLDVFYDADREAVQKHVAGCFERLGSAASWELRKVRKDGAMLWVRETARAMRRAGRDPVVLILCEDVTERKRAEEALHRVQAELAHVTRVTTLGELAASIAHEVNQPLAAIVADANAALNWMAPAKPDLDRVRQTLAAIVEDGHRAADVVQRIRQLATKTEPRKGRLDVNDVVGDVLALVRAELRHHAVTLRLKLAPDLAAILGDRVQLQQVVLNLVMNGIEAMASVADRPRELTITSEPHEGDQVVVAVHDTGLGIDAGDLERMFNAFFTTKTGGMGMGLSISRSIVEAHGGRLWAVPNLPHGAIVQFSLPTARRQPATRPTKVG